jgi:peptidoglycan/LPS O-acetylase OafA/YrhL
MVSYSVYLWQQMFLLVRRGDEPYAYFPLNLGLSLLCAVVSYWVVEQPAIRIGRKIAARTARWVDPGFIPSTSEVES